jgi:hypothetical protein
VEKGWSVRVETFIKNWTIFAMIFVMSQNTTTIIIGPLLGQYKNNKRNGKGTYRYSNGNTYIGDWVDDKMTGQGSFTWHNGDRYEMIYSQVL